MIAFIPRLLVAYAIGMTWDEASYVLSGGLALRNLVSLNFSREAWSFEFHPPVLMYLYAISYVIWVLIDALLRYGLSTDFSLLYVNVLNMASGQSALVAMRFPAVTLGALSCVIVYLFSYNLVPSKKMALLSGLALAFSPLFTAQTSLAVLDGSVAFFYVCAIWLFYRAARFGSVKDLVISSICAGLAFGSSETGFGILLILGGWVSVLLVRKDEQGTLPGLNSKSKWHLLIWLVLALAVFYVAWPWLWGDPIGQFLKNVRLFTTGHVRGGWKDFFLLPFDYYVVLFFVTTPVTLLILYGVGIIGSVSCSELRREILLLLLWVTIPTIVLGLPFVVRVGVRTITFIVPSLSILTGIGIFRLNSLIATMKTKEICYRACCRALRKTLIFIFVVLALCLLVVENAKIHPYYLDYYNQLVGGTNGAKDTFLVGWWGEGMDKAIEFIDTHAKANSTVWIYGPKSVALYHSTRVDLNKTLAGEPLFHARAEWGMPQQVDKSILTVRRGDLTFYFPYYYPERHQQLDSDYVRALGVQYVLVYRFYTYPGILDSVNYNFVTALMNSKQAAYTVAIHNVVVCWVYEI